LTSFPDALILGAGPSALALAASLGQRGLRVALMAPAPRAPWSPTWGLWEDELTEPLPERCVERRWSEAALVVGEPRRVSRTYLRVQKVELQRWLLSRAEAAGVQLLEEEATASWPRGLLTARGEEVDAGLVVDCSGAQSAFTSRQPGPEPGAQAAWGERLELRGHGLEDRALLMDWSPAGADALDEEARPSFLYLLPEGPDHLFAEETSLCARPPLPLPLLERRLAARLARMGLGGGHRLEEERCLIPMGGGLPRMEWTLAFGAAAGMVHPATGYLLARALNEAPLLAEAIAQAGGGDASVKAGWRQLWPAGRRVQWGLYRFGLEVLLGLSQSECQRFFRAFFQLPDELWQGYWSGQQSLHAQLRTMAALYTGLDRELRARLHAALLRAPAIAPSPTDLLQLLWTALRGTT
jgi:lycopene cyclase-like protein